MYMLIRQNIIYESDDKAPLISNAKLRKMSDEEKWELLQKLLSE